MHNTDLKPLFVPSLSNALALIGLYIMELNKLNDPTSWR